jgi:hypothetical protein
MPCQDGRAFSSERRAKVWDFERGRRVALAALKGAEMETKCHLLAGSHSNSSWQVYHPFAVVPRNGS